MSDIVSYSDVESRIIEIRGEKVILDRDVAELYGVSTKEINQAVKRNPDKFPDGYIFEITADEREHLWSQIVTTNISTMTRVLPTAFTEKGLYMLATILKSPAATQTTIAIVETFAKLRELSGVLSTVYDAEDKAEQKALLSKSGALIGEILGSDALDVIGNETTFELDLALVKIKHSVKREKRK